MTDVLSPDQRRQLMGRVSRRDTKPEWIVRSALHRLGFRYRLDSPDLPGHPDLVLPKYRSVVFVHGCFWHAHEHCRRASLPRTNHAFWRDKLQRNVERDKEITNKLLALGWRVLVAWECELNDDPVAVIERLVAQLTDVALSDGDYRERVHTLTRKQLLGVAEDKVRYRLGDKNLRSMQSEQDKKSQ
jgi:DNA mismatch endonuclease (patch repair protein)